MKRLILAFVLILVFAVSIGCENEGGSSTVESVATESLAESAESLDESADGSAVESSFAEPHISTGESSGNSSDENSENSLPSSDAESSLPENSDTDNSKPETFEPENSDASDDTTSNNSDNSDNTSDIPDTSDDNSDTSDIPDTSDDPDNDKENEDDPPVFTDTGDAELLPTGYLIYNGAAYTAASFSEYRTEGYAEIYAHYAEQFPNIRISVINPPLSIFGCENPLVRAMMKDQGEVLDKMEAEMYGDVNFINLKNTFAAHRGEYLYFKSDYHWTQLGAYYAYCDFAKSIGITPTPLSGFEELIVNDAFIGRSNDYANDDRINSFYDTIYAYMPNKEHTMTIYNSDRTIRGSYDNCIRTEIKSYSCFIVGDNPITIINVPENDQDKAVLVIKESSGNAFVPYLTEHYGNIIVIDPRHININIRDMLTEYSVDDIVFFTMASTANGSAYCDYYWNLIYS